MEVLDTVWKMLVVIFGSVVAAHLSPEIIRKFISRE